MAETLTAEQRIQINHLQDGDILGFSGVGFVSDVINITTYGVPRWGLSHVGIVYTYKGRKFIFESTTLNGNKPCAILNKNISGSQAHPIEDIFSRPGKVWQYPLTASLNERETNDLGGTLIRMLGRPYDYLGAGRSGGFLFRTLEGMVRYEDLGRLFCSELVGHALTRIGRAWFENASEENPNSLVRQLHREYEIHKRVRLK